MTNTSVSIYDDDELHNDEMEMMFWQYFCTYCTMITTFVMGRLLCTTKIIPFFIVEGLVWAHCTTSKLVFATVNLVLHYIDEDMIVVVGSIVISCVCIFMLVFIARFSARLIVEFSSFVLEKVTTAFRMLKGLVAKTLTAYRTGEDHHENSQRSHYDEQLRDIQLFWLELEKKLEKFEKSLTSKAASSPSYTDYADTAAVAEEGPLDVKPPFSPWNKKWHQFVADEEKQHSKKKKTTERKEARAKARAWSENELAKLAERRRYNESIAGTNCDDDRLATKSFEQQQAAEAAAAAAMNLSSATTDASDRIPPSPVAPASASNKRRFPSLPTRKVFPKSKIDKVWDKLTEGEKNFAIELGYTKPKWNSCAHVHTHSLVWDVLTPEQQEAGECLFGREAWFCPPQKKSML